VWAWTGRVWPWSPPRRSLNQRQTHLLQLKRGHDNELGEIEATLTSTQGEGEGEGEG
jgi:hypothetical protein